MAVTISGLPISGWLGSRRMITILQRTGDLVGTLRYMSPDKSEAIDRRSMRTDIYALGVTLYELLTLRPAFNGRNRDELVRQILDEDPVAPPRINASVPRDLETISSKRGKEPSARYGGARELADDLRRFLDNEPIHATRPTVLDRAVKWSRRHRAAVVASTMAPVAHTDRQYGHSLGVKASYGHFACETPSCSNRR